MVDLQSTVLVDLQSTLIVEHDGLVEFLPRPMVADVYEVIGEVE